MLTLSMVENKTGYFLLSVYQYDGVTPQNLVGSTLYFHAAYGSNFAINKSSPSTGITITNPAGGLNCATLQIDPADTAALNLPLPAQIAMACELSMTDPSGHTWELDSGQLLIAPNVGTP